MAKGKKNCGLTLSVCRSGSIFFLFTFAFCLLHFSVSAQDDPSDGAPPPLRMISKAERASLDGESDVKDRTKLALQMMDTRLDSAEKYSAGHDLDAMYKELGEFQGLVGYAFDFLKKLDPENGKVIDNFKRLEIALRGFMPRLETIRRDVPTAYDPYLLSLIRFLRDTRAKAIDPMFSDTVVPEKKDNENI